MIEKKGDLANLRHILLKPQFSVETQNQAITLLDSIALLIKNDSLTFEQAALRFSEDKETRLNGGYVINPATQTRRFEKDQLQPADYFVLRDMKVGSVSHSFPSKDMRGNDNFKIMKLTQVLPTHRADWEQDYGLICDIARRTQQQKIFEQWIEKAIGSAVINISSKMQDCEMQHKWK
jgi:peptidyl-prolyl cis-trans isomerase SurA